MATRLYLTKTQTSWSSLNFTRISAYESRETTMELPPAQGSEQDHVKPFLVKDGKDFESEK